MAVTAPVGRALRERTTPRRESLNSARFAQLTPDRLVAVMTDADAGNLRDWADLCDRMYATDAHIRADWTTRCSAVAGARWVVEPGYSGDEARDAFAQEAADLYEGALRQVPSLEVAWMRLLDGLGNGLGALDIEWETGPDDVVRPVALHGVHARRFRFGAEWEPLLTDDGVTYDPIGKPLEPGRWIVHVPRERGYPPSAAVFRSLAWHYLFKRWGYQFWARGAERFSWPFTVAKVPRGADDSVRSAAKTGLEELSAEQAAVLEDPTAIEFIESTVKDGGTWSQFIDANNREISKAILGSTDSTEPVKVGAWKAVESRKGTTIDARIALDERGLSATLGRDLGAYFCLYNSPRWGGVVPPTPQLRWQVAAQREPIPVHILSAGAVTRDEARISIGLDPIGGVRGAELIGTAGPMQTVTGG